MWRLYKRTHFNLAEYIWVDPQGLIQFHRWIAPYGIACPVSDPSLIGNERRVYACNKAGWKLVKTKMTQGQLALGWLC